MKTKLLLLALLSFVGVTCITAQNRTTLYATNDELSDNLDLKAVASVFGAASSLQDFERRLNDPRFQLSNLDLNYDNQVDYLRVIEAVEQRTHVVLIQAVLGRDQFQDVATIEIEKNRNHSISIQVVGDVFMYGDNYIYEPVYYQSPAIYASFYVRNYRPYFSSWNWNDYPNYYVAWRPFPVYQYRNAINHCINVHNSYRFVNYRNSYNAPIICASNRQNYYEKRNPHYSFSKRNKSIVNRYELDRKRGNANRNYVVDYENPERYTHPNADSRTYSYNSNKESASINLDSDRGKNYPFANTRNNPAGKESNRMETFEQNKESRATRSYENRSAESNGKRSRTENRSNGNRENSVGNRRI